MPSASSRFVTLSERVVPEERRQSRNILKPSWQSLVADGLSNREVASELSLSEHTLKKYMFRIFDKLGIF
jgi:ATP/maltotriose-dependent transcriptional regulator MalT